MLVPRSKFGSSLYNVPLLLALRLFYHASPFEAAAQEVARGRSGRDIARLMLQEVSSSFAPATLDVASQIIKIQLLSPGLFTTYEKLSTADWLARVSLAPVTYAHHKLLSLTWTKSLASPLSHEFIQFVIEDTRSGHRSRHLTHRHIDGGDSVVLGFDWTSGEDPSQHHVLPLPLLSLIFVERPAMSDFAELLLEITSRKPGYSLLREMCWWYAEAVFDGAHSKFGGIVEEWDFAHLRYSFIVKTNVIKREKLVRHAEQFRRLNSEKMTH